ncbi:MAG: hypothetical protein E7324_05275 [Clostridiales bacterium]|nr:hypothetical protein [Clostridiales bacterium]
MKKWICLLLCALMICPALAGEMELKAVDTSWKENHEAVYYLGDGLALGYAQSYGMGADGSMGGAYLYHLFTGRKTMLIGSREEWLPVYEMHWRNMNLKGSQKEKAQQSLKANVPIPLQRDTVLGSWMGKDAILVMTRNFAMLVNPQTGECRRVDDLHPVGMRADGVIVSWEMNDSAYSLYTLQGEKIREVTMKIPEGYHATALSIQGMGTAVLLRGITYKINPDTVVEYAVGFFDQEGRLESIVDLGMHRFLRGPDTLLVSEGGAVAYFKSNMYSYIYWCDKESGEASVLKIRADDLMLVPLDQTAADPETGVLPENRDALIPLGISSDGAEMLVMDPERGLWHMTLSIGKGRLMMLLYQLQDQGMKRESMYQYVWDGKDMLTSTKGNWMRIVK